MLDEVELEVEELVELEVEELVLDEVELEVEELVLDEVELEVVDVDEYQFTFPIAHFLTFCIFKYTKSMLSEPPFDIYNGTNMILGTVVSCTATLYFPVPVPLPTQNSTLFTLVLISKSVGILVQSEFHVILVCSGVAFWFPYVRA